MIRKYVPTAIVGLLAGIGAIATSFAVTGGTQSFVVVPIEQFLTDVVPIEIIVLMIQNVGSLGAQFNLLVATGLTAGLFAVLTGLSITVGRVTGFPAITTPTLILSGWAFATFLTGAALVSFAAGFGGGMVVAVAQLVGRGRATATAGTNPDRRRIVGGGAVALGLGAVGAGSAVFQQPETTPSGVSAEDNPVDAVTINEQMAADDGGQAGGGEGGDGDTEGEPLDNAAAGGEISIAEYKRHAREQTLDVGDIEPLLSEQFYNVDISSFDPDLDRSSWSLSVTGAVENEFEITYEELREYRVRNRMATLRCVGDSLNGYKIDNAVWTGVPMEAILNEARPTSDSCCVMLRAADDYYNEFPIEALWDGMLAFGMNGQDLPRDHGHPVRALIPGHWGEINVKWLTEIEILEEEAEGYWEKKGWHGTGPVNTVAKLWDDGIVRHDDGRVTVAGHAYAGTRDVDRVEVSTDGGDTWNDAELIDPLPPAARERQSVVDVWKQYRYEFEADGSHEVVVRAIDGEGTIQKQEPADAFPRGATGWVSKTVTA